VCHYEQQQQLDDKKCIKREEKEVLWSVTRDRESKKTPWRINGEKKFATLTAEHVARERKFVDEKDNKLLHYKSVARSANACSRFLTKSHAHAEHTGT